MCEHCQASKVSEEPIPPGEEPINCEFVPDPEEIAGTMCDAAASVFVSEYYCESHLCQTHMEEMSAMIDEGLGDFLRSTGLQEATDFIPVKETAPCEHFPIEGMLGSREDARDAVECPRPAAYAQMIWEKTALCRSHARSRDQADPGAAGP